MTDMASPIPADDVSDLVRKLAALANPHRLRVLAALVGTPTHVSLLARKVAISRPLLQMHLARLEAAGLVRSRLELGAEGRALRIYEIAFTHLAVTPEIIVAAAASLPAAADSTPSD